MPVAMSAQPLAFEFGDTAHGAGLSLDETPEAMSQVVAPASGVDGVSRDRCGGAGTAELAMAAPLACQPAANVARPIGGTELAVALLEAFDQRPLVPGTVSVVPGANAGRLQGAGGAEIRKGSLEGLACHAHEVRAKGDRKSVV